MHYWYILPLHLTNIEENESDFKLVNINTDPTFSSAGHFVIKPNSLLFSNLNSNSLDNKIYTIYSKHNLEVLTLQGSLEAYKNGKLDSNAYALFIEDAGNSRTTSIKATGKIVGNIFAPLGNLDIIGGSWNVPIYNPLSLTTLNAFQITNSGKLILNAKKNENGEILHSKIFLNNYLALNKAKILVNIDDNSSLFFVGDKLEGVISYNRLLGNNIYHSIYSNLISNSYMLEFTPEFLDNKLNLIVKTEKTFEEVLTKDKDIGEILDIAKNEGSKAFFKEEPTEPEPT
ncbi:hypothetical protein, partial [Aliarcobacter skirrowii]|uniref:hypothetical protein n=1 Tax=Aliarcobacter skirrowii TaxID=28200 RepID=UPI000A568A2B